jgi:hypothetical protein
LLALNALVNEFDMRPDSTPFHFPFIAHLRASSRFLSECLPSIWTFVVRSMQGKALVSTLPGAPEEYDVELAYLIELSSMIFRWNFSPDTFIDWKYKSTDLLAAAELWNEEDDHTDDDHSDIDMIDKIEWPQSWAQYFDVSLIDLFFWAEQQLLNATPTITERSRQVLLSLASMNGSSLFNRNEKMAYLAHFWRNIQVAMMHWLKFL